MFGPHSLLWHQAVFLGGRLQYQSGKESADPNKLFDIRLGILYWNNLVVLSSQALSINPTIDST